VIGAELHLNAEATIRQEAATWPKSAKAGSNNVAVPLLQSSMFATLLLSQCSVFATFKVYLRYQAWVAQQHQAMSPLIQTGLHNQERLNEQKKIQKRHGRILTPTPVFSPFFRISPLFSPPHPENNASDLQTDEEDQ